MPEDQATKELHEQVSKLYSVLYENGFVTNMKLQAEYLKILQEDMNETKNYFKEFKTKFYNFLDTRAETCPTYSKDKREKRQSFLLLFSSISALTAALSTFVVLFKFFNG